MTVKTAVPARVRKAELPAVTAEAIAENELAAPFTETPEFKDALAAALAAKLAEAAKPVKVTGHRAYATKEIPSAMVGFTKWIEREFPEIENVDPRLVTIASKCYKYFQSSDLNQ